MSLTAALETAVEYLWPDCRDLGCGHPKPNTEQQIVDAIRGARTEAEGLAAASDALDYIESRKGCPKIIAALKGVLS